MPSSERNLNERNALRCDLVGRIVLSALFARAARSLISGLRCLGECLSFALVRRHLDLDRFRLFIAGGPLLPVHSSNELANDFTLLRYGKALERELEPLKDSFRDFHKFMLLRCRCGIIESGSSFGKSLNHICESFCAFRAVVPNPVIYWIPQLNMF